MIHIENVLKLLLDRPLTLHLYHERDREGRFRQPGPATGYVPEELTLADWVFDGNGARTRSVIHVRRR